LRELQLVALSARSEVPIPLRYKGCLVDCGFRADVIVEDAVIVELKTVEALMPINDAQLLTYMKLCNLEVGLMLNFNSTSLRKGVRRLALSSTPGDFLTFLPELSPTTAFIRI
jgi:GxxExxY protein